MRILYNHRSRAKGAEGIHISEIIESLRKLKNEVQVVSPIKEGNERKDSKKSNFLNQYKKVVPILFFRISELIYNFYSYRNICNEVRRFKPDFIYERYALFHFVGVKVAKKSKIPLILEVNTPYAIAWEKYGKIYFPKLAKKIEKYIFSQASAIITVTGALREYLISSLGIPPDKIFIMQNGVNVMKFNRRIDGKMVRNKYNLHNKITIGFVGSLRIWHGIDIFAKAIIAVCNKRKNVHFLIVGDGEMKSELEEKLRLNGVTEKVSIIGSLPHNEIPEYLAVMDIGVMPNSNFYGSPMKIFEYMAMGKAVIAPRISALEEVITHKLDGYLVESGNPKELENAMLYLIDNNEIRNLMGEKAFEKANLNYTWDKNAKEIIEIYKQIKNNPGDSKNKQS